MSTGPDAAVGYPIRAVADRLGVPVATLRSWNQRYQLGPGHHEPGRHRLYTAADIAVLERVVALVRAGASPSSAVAEVRVPIPEPGDRSALLNAAFALDSGRAGELLSSYLNRHGVVGFWEDLCRPAFADIVQAQQQGGSIDVEHLLSWCVTSALQAIPAPRGESAILLACTGGETHALPLTTLHAALAERGRPATMLGANTPTDALVDAIDRIPAPTVVLWSQQESTALASAVTACVAAGARTYVAGPGWASVRLPADVATLARLTEALDALD
ncbi:MerR family transcriptional regulator [Nocardia sp. SYP-A9097]|uniref:MerR family transcriptional regulator n=1 Tax=Nocardia sp. SYP-A9097 TaxID=2663237 RepID=UPI00129B5C46|nr:MerR family transcriptional regulator [Nocardia sp. SYP-A9097]MRH87592.1 MerR family transcriptional regulator [Nocardia sp. SYP-A9097]